MTKTVSGTICKGYEPIPGYVIEEMIGRGGFGEVWRASAPGGLKKAVKFVFGDQASERSQRERKSLERLRKVRHPFLLTLERFEAINDQLVIVTELADGSLEDVYQSHCEAGSSGIPRDLLLAHLHDAADALDYLHNEYRLQHLDVKPGNLLIIGGHVKVADFGLLKDLQEAECSVVGGLTPVYAPPELFDGCPSLHSDQYSLAVMYQELLTGTRPFQGRTIAQLATQHVHGTPNIQPLPPCDRPAVARALEKSPERRFESCLAFIDALRNARAVKRSQSIGANLEPAQGSAGEFDHIGSVEDLPQLAAGDAAVDDDRVSIAQEFALIVALGGTGAACLRKLRRRAGKHHNDGRLELHSVLIDTDHATLESVADPEIENSAGPCDLIHTPLKSAKEYRDAGTDRLRTISRRWIYNVPRSASTEGMRPLGRLALVDHGNAVKARLSQAIAGLMRVSGGKTPRVYLVGSLTGGSSSGMYLDVVHLLRDLLDGVGLEGVDILSMLTTTPIQADPGYPLALHDAHAALIEMNYFLKAGNGYPGDPGAGWPSVPAARTPLRNVYLISEPAAGSLSPTPVETIVDYVWTDSTGAGDLLASARLPSGDDKGSVTCPTLHSVGVVPLSDGIGMQEKVLSPSVVRQLLVQWLGLPSAARQAAVPLRDQLVRRIGISPPILVATVAEQLDRTSFRDQLSQIDRLDPDAGDQQWRQWLDQSEPMVQAICDSALYRTICSETMKRFFGQVSVALTDRHADLTTVIECMQLMQQLNRSSTEKLRLHPCPLLTDTRTCTAAGLISPRIAANILDHLNECLEFLTQRLERFASTLALGVVQAKKLQGGETNPWDLMPSSLRQQFDETVAQLHGAAVNQFLVRTLVDHTVNLDAGAMVNQLHDAATRLVKEVVDRQAPRITNNHPVGDSTVSHHTEPQFTPGTRDSDEITETSISDRVHAARRLKAGVQDLSVDQAVVAVKPELLEFGGQQRLILIVGSERERDQFEPHVRNAHVGSVTVRVVPGAAPKLVHEARRIELASLLARLTILNGGNAQITGRLSSRSDISW